MTGAVTLKQSGLMLGQRRGRGTNFKPALILV